MMVKSIEDEQMIICYEQNSKYLQIFKELVEGRKNVEYYQLNFDQVKFYSVTLYVQYSILQVRYCKISRNSFAGQKIFFEQTRRIKLSGSAGVNHQLLSQFSEVNLLADNLNGLFEEKVRLGLMLFTVFDILIRGQFLFALFISNKYCGKFILISQKDILLEQRQSNLVSKWIIIAFAIIDQVQKELFGLVVIHAQNLVQNSFSREVKFINFILIAFNQISCAKIIIVFIFYNYVF